METGVMTGDCREVLRTLQESSVDSVVTDPPYGLGFMGNGWDHGVPGEQFWRDILRVAKPGAHLLAFGGTRTFHRLAAAIEDAGWELRDTIMWVYGSGFPKSKNLDGERKGWGTALKPAWEPIIVARKPLVGTVAQNVQAHGTGALNIDGCRVPVSDASYAKNCSGDRGHAGTREIGGSGSTSLRTGGGEASKAGRWPANLIHDGSEEVLAAFPDAPGQMAAQRSDGKAQENHVYGALRYARTNPTPRGDTGSAARFFYCAKASKSERGDGNTHPTVKPTALMRYLCRLVTPPGGLVLDPFMGSGSTGKAAVLEGFRFTGIDLDPGYAETARKRIEAAALDHMMS